MAEHKSVEKAKKEIFDALCAAGADRDNALLVAESLVFADARGTRSHGLNMLDAYLERIRQGGINLGAKTAILRETACSVVMDCNGGFGQTGVQDLMDRLLEKVKDQSIVCGSVRNINHCGALAFYTRRAAAKGYISFLFANANPTVAPFGSMEAVLGTNPFSIGLPFGSRPLVLDMATSAVAKAKIYQAAKEGKTIDPSWALDANGNPTDDPAKAINGVLTAMAGPKGYGIAIAVEVLAGVLSGGGITGEVNSVHKNPQAGMNSGAFGVLVDLRAFMPAEEYTARMGRLVAEIKSAKPQPGKKVYLPGEIEDSNYDAALKSGIQY
jgi:LDH2 family malate/lactate/ureidoglycolate dehydrogenase